MSFWHYLFHIPLGWGVGGLGGGDFIVSFSVRIDTKNETWYEWLCVFE